MDVPSGTDQVICGFPIPRGGTLKNIWGDVHLVALTEEEVSNAQMYGITGFIVRLTDPDEVINLQTLWDTQVTKSVIGTSNAGLDLDTASADAGPEFEPGEMDIHELYRVGRMPVEVFKRRKMVTFADRPLGYEAISSAEDHYVPSDHFKVRVRQNYYVEDPSYVLFGISSPTLNRVTTTQPVTLSEEEWIQYTYLQDTLLDAQKYAAGGGLIDVGAESPYDKAALLVEKILTQDIFEETGLDFTNIIWATKSHWTFEVSFPGTFGIPTVAAAP